MFTHELVFACSWGTGSNVSTNQKKEDTKHTIRPKHTFKFKVNGNKPGKYTIADDFPDHQQHRHQVESI